MLKWKWGRPLIQGFSNEPQKGYTEIEPDAGIPFRRLNFTDIGDLATCSFDLDRTTYILFMNWYKYECRQGSVPFEIWDCRYKRERTARIVGGVPQYTTNSNRYTLSLTLYFQPEIIYQDFGLVVGQDDGLIVNANDALIAGQALRI